MIKRSFEQYFLLYTTILVLVLLSSPLAFSSNEGTLEVEYFWAGKSEVDALNVIKKEYIKNGNKWLASPIVNNKKLQDDVLQRFYAGAPPSSFQWHGNSSLEKFVEMGLIREITYEFMQEVSMNNVPQYVLDGISFDGKIYGLPVGIHCNNSAIYNAHIYDELNLEIPNTWSEVLIQAETIQSAGYIPLAIGNQNWEINNLFASVLTSKLSPEDTKEYYTNKSIEIIQSKGFLEATKILAELRKYKSNGTENWSDATKLVADNKAAMQFNGNWIWGEMNSAGMVPDKDYFPALTPEFSATELSLDIFMLTKTDIPSEYAGQNAFIKAVLNPQVQKEFSLIKGSFPCIVTNVTFKGNSLAIKNNLLNNENIITANTDSPFHLEFSTYFNKFIDKFWNSETMMPEEFIEHISNIVKDYDK